MHNFTGENRQLLSPQTVLMVNNIEGTNKAAFILHFLHFSSIELRNTKNEFETIAWVDTGGVNLNFRAAKFDKVDFSFHLWVGKIFLGGVNDYVGNFRSGCTSI